MRNKILIIICFLTIVFTITSCRQAETDPPTQPPKLSSKEILDFSLLRKDWTEQQMQEAGLQKTVTNAGEIIYYDGNISYTLDEYSGVPRCVEIYGECDEELPRGLYVGQSFEDVLASFPAEKDWQKDPNKIFYGKHYETDEHEPTGRVSAYEVDGYIIKMITITTEDVFPFLQIYFDKNDKIEKIRIYFISD